ncbi:hypothetical protein Hanom_Chr15g01408971 [Helianthus anomalus]
MVAVLSGYWMVSWPSPLSRDSRYPHISYSSPIKTPLCSIAIPSSDKSSIPSATDCVLCFRLSLAPPL